jgi:hypothetical protein
LAMEGFMRCVCHIRMTNVPSLAAFRRIGWHRVGWLVSSRSGRLLGTLGCARADIEIRAT